MMIVFAARNVFRHAARSAIAFAAIAFGVASLVVTGGFIADLYYQLGEAIIHSQTGHLQVAQPAFFAEGSRSPEKFRISDFTTIKSELVHLPGVTEVAGRLNFVGLLSNGRAQQPIVGEGIEPDKESQLMTSVTILSGRALLARDEDGALVGEGLAKKLGLKPGTPAVLVASTVDGAMNSFEVRVVGVFRSFSKEYDARAVKIPLHVAQDLLGAGDVNAIVLSLKDTSKTDEVLAKASALMGPRGLAVRSWKQLNPFYENTVKLFDREFGVLEIIILFMIALGVGNAINMAVFERLGEFGMMRTLGNRSGQVVRLILTECVLLGGLGAAGGVIIGAIIATVISGIGIPMPAPPNSNIGYTAVVRLLPDVMLQASCIGFAAAVLSGIIPAFRAVKVPIAEALRSFT